MGRDPCQHANPQPHAQPLLPPALLQVLRIELARKQTMMFYQPTKDRLFLKIVLATPNLVAPCRSEWSCGHGRRAGTGAGCSVFYGDGS